MLAVWVILSIAALFVLLLAASALFGLYAAHKLFDRRYNGNPHVKYFTADDFEGLRAEPITFSARGQTLSGFVYSREGEKRAAVIFSHGFGAGHTAYTTEIDRFTRAGFAVLAFDNAACVASGGKRLGGFDEGVADLLAAAEFAKSHPALAPLKKVFVGHSWGGFSVMNAYPRCEGVCCAVAMCGFIGSAQIVADTVFKRLAPFRAAAEWAIRLRSRRIFREYANYRADDALKATHKPLFLLYGEQDTVVPYRSNGKKLIAAAQNNAYVRTRAFVGKGHNVYLTEEAEKYMNETFAAIARTAKKDKSAAARMYAEVDYRAMTREDDAVMDEIVAFIGENI